MFCELWQGLRDLSHDNKTETAQNDAKRFINWTLRDLANEYEWPFLRGLATLTPTADDMTYNLERIVQPTVSAETLYVYLTATADGGSQVQVYGKRINTDGTMDCTCDTITLIATATATGGIGFSHIDSFRKSTTSGSIYIVNSSGVSKAILEDDETYVANDINKISAIADVSGGRQVEYFDMSTALKASPDGVTNTNYPIYDGMYERQIAFANVPANSVLGMVYQRIPKYLVKDYDRTEFPYSLYPGIIDATYIGWALRYQDEQDGTQGKAAYKEKLREIITAYTQGADRKSERVMPAWYRRGI